MTSPDSPESHHDCVGGAAESAEAAIEGAEKLATAIRSVLAAGIHVSPKMSERIVASFAGLQEPAIETPVGRLTDREFEVSELVGLGLSTEEIATRLHLIAKNIEAHRADIKTKLAIGSLDESVSCAARWTSSGSAPGRPARSGAPRKMKACGTTPVTFPDSEALKRRYRG